jgi:hypothetical protein
MDMGEDEKGCFIGIGGDYEHSKAFGHHYLAQPYIRMYEGAAVIEGSMRLINLQNSPMEYMYLAHINFHPVDKGRFVYSAKYNADHVKVRAKFPDFMKPNKELQSFLDKLVIHPENHHTLKNDQVYDPEVVFYISYDEDENGLSHAMQIHPDGSADYVSHRPSQLDVGVRWICRTPDIEALGMEAGTAGTEGYTAEKKKGSIKSIGPGEEFFCDYSFGLLKRAEANTMEKKINHMMGR